MKKDIAWLKKEIGTEMMQLEPNRKERWSDVKYQTLRNVCQKIYQLDEQEALSQEWIRNNQERKGVHFFVNVTKLQNLIVPKQELPVVPKHVGEWITRYREKYDLYPALRLLENNTFVWGQIYEWYRINTREFVNAYLTGEYEVEEEPLYYALVKGHEIMVDDDTLTFKYWNYDTFNGDLFPSNRSSRDGRFLIDMSKSEWNKLGINDSNADFVKVDEELN